MDHKYQGRPIAAVAALVLALLPLVPAFGADATSPVSVWAVEAAEEGRREHFFERGLAPVQPLLEELPYDTYRRVLSKTEALPVQEERSFPLMGGYTLILRAVDQDARGQIRLDIVVEKAAKDPERTPVKALSSRLVLPPGKLIMLRGLKLDAGELIVVLKASAAD